MAWKASTVAYVSALLVCGSLNTITLKIAFTTHGTGVSGQPEGFQKPWFMTFLMFVAMSLALPFDRSIRHCQPCFAKANALLADLSPGGPLVASTSPLPWRRKVVLVSMPAFFDILATALCNMGMLYIPASVWQLLRGAELVFAAFFAVVCLGRRLHSFHWIGLTSCVLGIAAVGFASVLPQNPHSGSTPSLLLGMALALLGQVVAAAQVVAEEWLLKDVDLPELQIVGFEGVWGGLTVLALAPLLYWLPGADGGHLEDERDTWALLSSNGGLVELLLVYSVSCCSYNMAGIAVTGALSAVHRVMLEALRTSVVWAFGLAVHYGYSAQSAFGERWTVYSFLEVAGFALLILGQAVYGAMVHLPGLEYPAEPASPQQALASPGSVRNLASPLPPVYALEVE